MFPNSAKIASLSHDHARLFDNPARKWRKPIDRFGQLPILADDNYPVIDGDPPIAEEHRPQGAEVIGGV